MPKITFKDAGTFLLHGFLDFLYFALGVTTFVYVVFCDFSGYDTPTWWIIAVAAAVALAVVTIAAFLERIVYDLITYIRTNRRTK